MRLDTLVESDYYREIDKTLLYRDIILRFIKDFKDLS